MVTVVYDRQRGCGWRKPGGLYLMCNGPGMPCGRLPIALEVCPWCGGGIKPTRSWAWVNGTQVAAEKQCTNAGGRECAVCPLSKPMGRVGLLWIGEAFYKTPDEFIREANAQGLSRRISTVPKGFVIGETWVWLAHRKTIRNADGSWTAGVFRAFKPDRIEYVTRGDETQEELERLEKRGITPVHVERETPAPLFDEP
jgi:hypothetical protein